MGSFAIRIARKIKAKKAAYAVTLVMGVAIATIMKRSADRTLI
jgi:hypothetical protein